jgi:hypothetical protein
MRFAAFQPALRSLAEAPSRCAASPRRAHPSKNSSPVAVSRLRDQLPSCRCGIPPAVPCHCLRAPHKGGVLGRDLTARDPGDASTPLALRCTVVACRSALDPGVARSGPAAVPVAADRDPGGSLTACLRSLHPATAASDRERSGPSVASPSRLPLPRLGQGGTPSSASGATLGSGEPRCARRGLAARCDRLAASASGLACSRGLRLGPRPSGRRWTSGRARWPAAQALDRSGDRGRLGGVEPAAVMGRSCPCSLDAAALRLHGRGSARRSV